MDHRLKQFIARVNLVAATLPELEFAPFDAAAITTCLARAFTGLSLVNEAKAAPLIPAFHQYLQKEQVSWLDELTPLTIPWLSGGTIKVSYVAAPPEAHRKLQECFALKEHPTLCEGRLPVLLQLYTPTANASPRPLISQASRPANSRSIGRRWRRSFRGCCGGDVLVF